jgi:multisubunit Na+/H+ antiporter MnhB subunit
VGFGGVLLGLGSMGMAIGATAVVVHPGDSPGGGLSFGAVVLTTLIWVVIAAINISYARHR